MESSKLNYKKENIMISAQYIPYIEAAKAKAEKLLANARVGEEFTIEGSCPSGSTYGPFIVFDGSDENRAAIIEMAENHSLPNAWQGRLVRSKDVRQGMFVADMRTGG
jgi:hypothetical protein